MPEILQISHLDIERLNAYQLTALLSKLLYCKASNANIHASGVHVPMEINVPDGGEDGRIRWENGTEKTDWIPNRYTMFQCKATRMQPADCANEVLTQNKQEIKPSVKDVLDADGAYILFCNDGSYSRKMINARIKAITSAIQSVGYTRLNAWTFDIYDSNKIVQWSNKYLACIVYICSCVGRTIPYGLRTWKSMNEYKQYSFEYVMDDVNQSHIESLRKHFFGNEKQIARIIGLSGLGKTRLVLEAFRPSTQDTIVQNIESNKVVFIPEAETISNFTDIVYSWVEAGMSGLIIVDNCSLRLHNKIQNEITRQGSCLSLLTIDYNLTKDQDASYPLIEVQQSSKDVIVGILKQEYKELSDQDVSRIADFATGFPQMAVLLAKARLSGSKEIGRLHDDEIMDKLLWGRSDRDEIAEIVIRACSIFEHIGFYENVAVHRIYIAEKICNIDPNLFYTRASKFIERGILQKNGRFVQVTPGPLAVRLASEFWRELPTERALELILGDLPDGLVEPLCKQFSKLHFLDETRKLVLELCGEQAPFGNAEVLISERGSRIFRSMVEVNPEACASALSRSFGTKTVEDLKKIVVSRRNLVWALEKLCFWENTFSESAGILFLFACAENESWSNNATGQFSQLFYYSLSGTQAPLFERIQFLESLVAEFEDEMAVKVVIRALSSSLSAQGHSRMIGSEIQGSRPVQSEYLPLTWDEVYNYWTQSLELLISIYEHNTDARTVVAECISDSFWGLAQYGMIDKMRPYIEAISLNNASHKELLNKKISEFYRIMKDKLEEETKLRVSSLLEFLKPNTLKEQISHHISNAKWEHEKNPDGSYRNLAEERAIALALEVVNNIDAIYPCLDAMLQGDQNQGFVFGKSIALNLRNADGFVKDVVRKYTNLNENQNPAFMVGLLVGIMNTDSEIVKWAIDFMIENGHADTVILVVKAIGLNNEYLELILKLVDEGKLEISTVLQLQYGGALLDLSIEDLKSFIITLSNYGNDGAAIALSLFVMGTLDNPDKKLRLIGVIRDLLMKSNLLESKYLEHYNWQEMIKWVVTERTNDYEFITFTTEEVINSLIEGKLGYSVAHTANTVIQVLLESSYTVAWPIFYSRLIDSTNYLVDLRLTSIFRPSTKLGEEAESIMRAVPHEYLVEWCDSLEKAELLSKIVVPYDVSSGKIVPSRIAVFLLLNYPEYNKVLSNLMYNMSPNGWSGSIVPYYHQAIKIIKEFEQYVPPKLKREIAKAITTYNQWIERETIRDQERNIGIY